MNRINILLIVIALCFASGITNAQYLKELKMKESSSISNNTLCEYQSVDEKYPVYAGVVSFILPGLALGQLYNEQPKKFAVHISITGACVLVAALGIANFQFNVGGGPTQGNPTIGPLLFLISAGVFTGNWIWSVFDAVISANNVNKKVRLQKNRTNKIDNIRFGFGLDRNKNLNLRTIIYF